MMTLFRKHFFRTLRRAPLQPLLILLTVALSVAATVAAVTAMQRLDRESEERTSRYRSLGDILISMRGDAEMGFLFEEDAHRVLDVEDLVLGEYAFTAFPESDGGKTAISAAAVDLIAADRFFGFSYKEYGSFTVSELDRSVIVSSPASERYGWHVGSEIALSVLGQSVVYRVEAVAEPTGLLSERDLLIPCSSLLRELSVHFPLLSVLSSAPATRLMIRLKDASSVQDVCARLLAADDFSDKNVRNTIGDGSEAAYVAFTERLSLWMLTAVLTIFSSLLIGTALQLLEKERETDRALFRYAGASLRQIAGIRMAESLIYAFAGSIGGLLLASPMVALLCCRFSWFRGDAQIGTAGAVIGIVLAFLLVPGCTAIRMFITRGEPLPVLPAEADRARRGAFPVFPALLSGIPALLCQTAALLLPIRHRYLLYISLILFLSLFLYRVFPIFLSLLLRLLLRLSEHAAHCFSGLRLALRTAKTRFSAAHVGRLFALTFAFLFLMVSAGQEISRQVWVMENAVTAELCALYVPSSAKPLLEDREQIAATAGISVFSEVSCDGGVTFTALSIRGDAEQCLLPELLPDRLPQGDEVILPSGALSLLGVKQGDLVTLTIEGVVCRLRVAGTTAENYLFLDADALGLLCRAPVTCIRLAPGADRAEVIGMLEASGVLLTDANVLFENVVSEMSGFLWMVRVYAVFTLFLTLAACMNVFAEQHRAGKGDRERAMLAGASRANIRSWDLWEMILVLFAAIVCGILTGLLFYRISNEIMLSFGITIHRL